MSDMDIDQYESQETTQTSNTLNSSMADAEMADAASDMPMSNSSSASTVGWTAIPKVGFSVHTSEENDYVDT
ncbi:hypothetical protein GGI07_005509, partial [Coemansia sp. Benny D115]